MKLLYSYLSCRIRIFSILMMLLFCSVTYSQAFITTWKTDNPGTSNNYQITIPTAGGGYNYTVYWGDGSYNLFLTGDFTHTYPAAGTYTVTITGDFPRIYFNYGGDREKILSVEQWGDIQWTSMANAFQGCSNLVVNATDAPDLSGVSDLSVMFFGTAINQDISNWDVSNITNMYAMFYLAQQFNQDIGTWNVGNVTNMAYMFSDASAFNQDISNWDVSKVTNMEAMFSVASSFDQDLGNWNVGNVTNMLYMFNLIQLSKQNYDNTLIGWNSLPSLQNNVTLTAGNSQYCNGSYAKQNIISNHNWTISDGGEDCTGSEFITTWKTDNPGGINTQITIPTTGGGYNYTVDWGDGLFDINVTGNITHDYAVAGTYTVKITGQFPHIYFAGALDKQKILSIDQWGTQHWTSMLSAFTGCSNLVLNATDTPDLSGVTSMWAMFANATSFNGSIGNWDVSHVTDMKYLFQNASSFNQDISGWVVSGVENMANMFWNATAFNQNISTWDVSSVVDMSQMFDGAAFFNQPIESWAVSSVTNMSCMFNGAESFNQDIGLWDVSSVTDMSLMFSGAVAFDQNIGNWQVGNVGNFEYMFTGVTLSTENYDKLLIGWNSLPYLQGEIYFDAGNSHYCGAITAKSDIINNWSWSISDGGIDCSDYFITNWDTSISGTPGDNTITIPTAGDGYNYTVNWGDNTISENVTGNISHTYDSPGIYIVKIFGDFPGFVLKIQM